MRLYPVTTCLEMIRHYQALSTNPERTENVRFLAALSLAEWERNLHRARGD